MDLTVKPEDDSPAPLSDYWAATFNHTAKRPEAVSMRSARAAYLSAAQSLFTSDAGIPSAQEFQAANAAIELLNRRYAAVYYAPDATSLQRIDSLEEIANILLRWSQRLGELGLDKLPKSYRTNGAIALTFEDVVHGPAKRWHNEGVTLANTCVARAKSENVNSYSARSCSGLVVLYAKTPALASSEVQPERACIAGDLALQRVDERLVQTQTLVARSRPRAFEDTDLRTSEI